MRASVAVLLLVALSFPAISPAQTASAAPVQTPQVSESQLPATPAAEQTQAPTPSQPIEAASQDGPPVLARSTPSDVSQAQTAAQIPTATQIENKASAAAASEPDAKPAAIVPGAPSQNQQPHGIPNPAGPLQPKYDVSQIGHRNVGSGLDFYSIDREIELGRELSKEVEQSARLVKDPIVTEYVNRIGQNLVRNSDARVPFSIKVLDTDEINAFALPGGFFYVNSGLILAADNEAELAGVMAHEIGHVAARHATKNMTRAQIWNMATIPLIFMGGPIAFAISEVASIAVPMTFLKFSRDAEREADLLGLEYDYVAGYDPQAFVQFFEKLNVDQKKKHSRLAKAFATHPMTADRIEAAQEEIRKYLPDRPEYVVNTSEFDNVKARLMLLEYGHRLGGSGGDGNRPVLLNRSASSSSTSDPSAGSSSQGGSGTTDQKDDDRPTLKRNPNPSDP
jgi:Peptidase family M48